MVYCFSSSWKWGIWQLLGWWWNPIQLWQSLGWRSWKYEIPEIHLMDSMFVSILWYWTLYLQLSKNISFELTFGSSDFGGISSWVVLLIISLMFSKLRVEQWFSSLGSILRYGHQRSEEAEKVETVFRPLLLDITTALVGDWGDSFSQICSRHIEENCCCNWNENLTQGSRKKTCLVGGPKASFLTLTDH